MDLNPVTSIVHCKHFILGYEDPATKRRSYVLIDADRNEIGWQHPEANDDGKMVPADLNKLMRLAKARTKADEARETLAELE